MAVTPVQAALSRHRFERAEATLREAQDELSRGNYRLTVNRAYYSLFYAMRAFLALANMDSSKHSGVASLFNQHFIRNGIVPEVSFKAIQTLMDLRHEGDYQDFAEITAEEASGAAEAAGSALNAMRSILASTLDADR